MIHKLYIRMFLLTLTGSSLSGGWGFVPDVLREEYPGVLCFNFILVSSIVKSVCSIVVCM